MIKFLTYKFRRTMSFHRPFYVYVGRLSLRDKGKLKRKGQKPKGTIEITTFHYYVKSKEINYFPVYHSNLCLALNW